MKKVGIIAAVALSLAVSFSAVACPKVGRLPDFNCDQKIVGVVLGDSLASGYGDTVNGDSGGYVLRASRRLPEVTLENFGKKGLMTRQLVLDIEQAFSGRGDALLADALARADFVILDLGRNDRWLFGEPTVAARNLRRAQSLIMTNVEKVTGTSPLVITSVLMLPNRGSQGPWVKDLNKLIQLMNSATTPADLRFDLVSKRLLSGDQIHPTPKGYAALANTLVSYLLKVYPKHVSTLRSDDDNDGLYDILEMSRFGTDPANPDTDGDGILDGNDPTPTGDQ